jgi:hypothetical protein
MPAITPLPTCIICTKPVNLENSKADEWGNAVHEECYLLKIQLKRATTPPFEPGAGAA